MSLRVHTGRNTAKFSSSAGNSLLCLDNRLHTPCSAGATLDLLRAELEQMEVWLIEERAQLQDELQEARAEADRHAEMHTDRARLQAELEQTRAELARARRPWRRRLVES
jgi:hypothetical protein